MYCYIQRIFKNCRLIATYQFVTFERWKSARTNYELAKNRWFIFDRRSKLRHANQKIPLVKRVRCVTLTRLQKKWFELSHEKKLDMFRSLQTTTQTTIKYIFVNWTLIVGSYTGACTPTCWFAITNSTLSSPARTNKIIVYKWTQMIDLVVVTRKFA